jgi:hypothetical protein
MNIMDLLTVGNVLANGSGGGIVGWLVGGEGPVLQSGDGISWTSAGNPLGTGGVIRALTTGVDGDGTAIWIAAGNNSDNTVTLVYNKNSLIWTPMPEDPFAGGQANCIITFQLGKVSAQIAIGYVNGVSKFVYRNPSGITWETTFNLAGMFTKLVSGDGGGQLQLIAAGSATETNTSMAMSSDGVTWSCIPAENDPFPGGTCTVLKFFNFDTDLDFVVDGVGALRSLWVAGGANTLVVSRHGTAWTTVFTGINFTPSSIEYVNGKWYVVGSGSYYMMTSTDLVSWTTLNESAFYVEGFQGVQGPKSIFYGGGVFIVAGKLNGGSIVTSTNGTTWSLAQGLAVTDPFAQGGAITVSYGNGLWLAGGYGPESLATSVDGLTWTKAGNPLGSGGTVRSVILANAAQGIPKWVAVGNNVDCAYCIAWSSNGVTWYAVAIPGAATKVIYVNFTWYAIGLFFGGQGILTSTDGVFWTNASVDYLSSQPNTIVWGIDAIGYQLIITGGSCDVTNGYPSMRYSPDGSTFYPIPSANDPYFGTTLTALHCAVAPYNGYTYNLWVAGGYGNTITVSTNGFVWTTVYTDASFIPSKIIYNNGIWTVVGTGPYCMITSPNLITWTPVYQPAFPAGAGILDAVYADSMLVAVGGATGGSIAVKKNGQWSVIGAPGTTPNIPDAPTDITVVPSSTSAMVSWTPPTANPELTGYKIYSMPDNKLANTAGPTATSLNVTGLKNGTAYRFSVVATNSLGSSYMATCTPSTLPGVPKVTAVAGNAQVTLSWVSAPGPGVPTTGYTITCNQSVSIPPNPTSPLVITGLNNGTSYIFSVSATNIIGTSAAGAAKAVVPVSVPDVPQAQVLAGIKSFQVTWSAPFNGGLPITEYAITYVGAGRTTVAKGKAVAPFTLMATKLVTGTSYSVTIQAKNKLGLSAASSPIEITIQ